ncbi:MAG: hypothetical protein MPW14_14340 [Candidatus Manganitrophus sp.]|nr:hypothetical protein [Candidatus Manganitrophus sp.]MDC4223076.1 hypothetical protein [Candidatus Manganitrophus sp.]WDT69973.1 MAG: hypothetical protein MPW17_14530 [Candidatus Manganitrophus sp.]WDT78382.1 MAG: hypothetical protein MPW14_14340 [Candidatus Manganitrophus sp.]
MTTSACTRSANDALRFSMPRSRCEMEPGAGVMRIGMKTKTSAEISILTDEGDVVTISGASSMKAKYLRYDSQGRSVGGEAESAKVLRISVRQRFSISIQGDLSEEERADIDRLLGVIEDTFLGALDGNSDTTDPQRPSADLGSLASVSASFKYSAKISAFARIVPGDETAATPPAEAATDGASPPAVGGEDTGAPSPVATPVENHDGGMVFQTVRFRFRQQIAVYQRIADMNGQDLPQKIASPADPSVSSPAPAPNVPTEEAASVPADEPAAVPVSDAVDPIVKTVEQARVERLDLVDLIGKFLDALIASLPEQVGADEDTVRLASQIKAAVVEQLGGMPEPPSASVPGTEEVLAA